MLITIFTYIYICLLCFVEMSSWPQSNDKFIRGRIEEANRNTENRKMLTAWRTFRPIRRAAFIHEHSHSSSWAYAAPSFRTRRHISLRVYSRHVLMFTLFYYAAVVAISGLLAVCGLGPLCLSDKPA